MAAALVGDASRFMGEKLSDLLQLNDKLKAITDIEGKMEKLKDLSTIIDKVIQDLDSRPSIDDAVKDLLKKLKYLARDLEDVVDHYDTKVFQKQQRSNTSFGLVRTHFARPNWKEVFTKLTSKHPGATVGVFYCGAPTQAKELRNLSLEMSHRTSTRFHFHKEHFEWGIPDIDFDIKLIESK